MPKMITHFMWGYQQHFRSGVAFGTERILNALEPKLQPEVFLIGIRNDDSERSKPACVEPEIHHWAESARFYDVLKDVDAIQQSYPESQMFHSHPIAQANEDQRLFRRALRDAVLRRLDECPGRPAGTQLFASVPVERDGFLVLTVIAVHESGLSRIPTLADGEIRIHDYRYFRAPRNLIEAVIDEILNRSSQEIIQPDAGAGLSVLGSSDELLRRAGLRFFSGLLHRVDDESLISGMATTVFDAIARLTLTPYESAEAAGSLIFSSKKANIGQPVLTLDTPVPLGQIRALRKLLVLASNGLFLRCNCGHALALIRTDGSTRRPDDGRGCEVRITGRGKWTVSMDGNELMVIRDGNPSLPKPLVDERNLAADLRRIIPSMATDTARSFAQIGKCLAESGHGALLVITENAVDEASRLASDGLQVAPLELTSQLAPELSAIDGALVCSPDGMCHAVGVILDGLATAGDRSRGSRFNSAYRYVMSSKSFSAALVVSEDGGLDLLPKLRPALSHAELDTRLNDLERLANAPSDPPDLRRESNVIDWVERHAFYLSVEQCANANAWIATCDDRRARDPEVMVRIVRQPLQPHPDFQPARDLV